MEDTDAEEVNDEDDADDEVKLNGMLTVSANSVHGETRTLER